MSVNEVYFTLNLTGPAVTETVVSVALFDAEGSEFDASQIVFSAVARHVETRLMVQVGCSLGGRPNLLILRFPALLSGKWEYEVWGTFDDGTRSRFAAGIYTALSTVARFEEKKPEAGRSLTAIVGKDMQVLSAMSNASTVAEMAALRADRAADAADDAARRLDETQETVDALKRGIAQALSISPQGTLVIGTTDTGFVLKGVPGMNADEVQYHKITSVGQLPTDDEHCNPYHRYVLAQNETHAMWSVSLSTMTQAPDRLINFGGLYVISAPENTSDFDNLAAWEDALNGTVARDFIEVVDIAPVPDSSVIRVYFQAKAAGSAANNLYPTSSAFATDSVVTGADGIVSIFIWANDRWTALPLTAPTKATTLADGFVRVSTDSVLVSGINIGYNALGQIVADSSGIPLPLATPLKAGVMRAAAEISSADTGVPTASQVYAFHNNQIQTMVQQAVETALAERVQPMLESFMKKDAIQVVEELPVERVDGVIYIVVRPQ